MEQEAHKNEAYCSLSCFCIYYFFILDIQFTNNLKTNLKY
jgi:hypothetical protein